jgi:hypothetical protein
MAAPQISTTRRLLPLALGGAVGLAGAIIVAGGLLGPTMLMGLGALLAFTSGYSSAWSP